MAFEFSYSKLPKFIRKRLGRAGKNTAKNAEILAKEFGFWNTAKEWKCIDAEGKPLPWYTYPAIEYIRQLDLSDKTVLEFGSGYSTLFWASRCKKVYAIEDDAKWHAIIAPDAPANVEYLLLEDRDAYINAARTIGEPQFDIIIVDGSHRYQCAENSRPLLNPSGFMILDNSDWREETSRFLRDSDLIEVDMSGFGPINPYTWTTSFYFSRQVQLKPAGPRQPLHGIGAIRKCEQDPLSGDMPK